MKSLTTLVWLPLIALLLTCNPKKDIDLHSLKSIDRHALVSRNNPVLTQPDTLGSLTVGNGGFAFTVDASGLQTFYKEYENGIPLGTMSDWGWHATPDSNQYTLNDVAKDFESCDGQTSPYPVQHSSGRAGDATNYLRANPHRLHLGLFGLDIQKKNGAPIELQDIKNLRQELDLWTGTIETSYDIEGTPVRVVLVAYPQSDGIAVRVTSPLIREGKLKLRIRFPYAKDCHVCPGYDFEHPEKHSTEVFRASNSAEVTRKLDSAYAYELKLSFTTGELKQASRNDLILEPSSNSDAFELKAVFFGSIVGDEGFDEVKENAAKNWEEFWTSGGAIDFSECTDPRAKELERRVVLSQYLTAVQCSGSKPPQETGLTMNSWYGKFHLEMHLWHAAHFGMWNRRNELNGTLDWYSRCYAIEQAAATATRQGYEGLRWPKMTDRSGNESPSDIGAFIIWQQPHPIFLAETAFNLDPEKEKQTLEHYQNVVFGTADFMSSFIKLRDGKYHLCHPLMPAQEIFSPTETDDPTYELQYWHYALTVAQEWRKRLGMPPNEKWQEVIDNIAPLPLSNGLYLPVATAPDAYTKDEFRRDHPSVLAALGFLPVNNRLDTAVMHRTLNEILHKWDWSSTWGWDYPMIAMTATRLYEPEKAIEALLMDTQKNTYLVNGHNYQDKRLRLYLPGNGGVLAATALMAAGWQGCTQESPGFPKDGRWNVRWENLAVIP